jgi:MFS family permease
MVAAWVGGFIADRSRRPKLTAGFGYAISAACRLGWLMLAGRSISAVAGLIVSDRFGKAVRVAPRDAMISLSVPRNQLATAFGVHRALDATGAAIGPVLAFALLWQLPQRYDVVFFTSFVAALLGIGALILLVDGDVQRPAAATESGTDRLWPEALAAFTNPAVRRILVLATVFGLVTIGDALIYLMLIQRSHASSEWIPLLYTGTAVSFLTLAVPAGYIADRFDKQRMFILGHGSLLLAYAVAAGGLVGWPWNAVACVVLLGTYYAFSDGVLPALASSRLPASTRAVGLAWVATGVGLARLSGSIGFGLLWTRAGDRIAVLTFSTALLVVACVGFWTREVEEAVSS